MVAAVFLLLIPLFFLFCLWTFAATDRPLPLVHSTTDSNDNLSSNQSAQTQTQPPTPNKQKPFDPLDTSTPPPTPSRYYIPFLSLQ